MIEQQHHETPIYQDAKECECGQAEALTGHAPGGAYDPREVCLRNQIGVACWECSSEWGKWTQHIEDGTGKHRGDV